VVPHFDSSFKLFLLFLLGMGLPLTLQAQSDGKQSNDSNTLRISGGINRAFMSGDIHDNGGYYLLSTGISYTYMPKEPYGFSIGLFYESKGGKKVPGFWAIFPNPSLGATYFQQLNYITFPIHVVYQQEVNDNINIRYRSGLYYGYLLEWIEIVDYHREQYATERIRKEINHLKRSDYGIQVGVEGYYSLNHNFSISLQLVHSAGIRNIEDTEGYYSPLRTNATQLSLGLVYKL